MSNKVYVSLMCVCRCIFSCNKISYEFIVDKLSERQLDIAVEVNLMLQSFCEQQDIFVVYQSLIYVACLAKNNSEEKKVR